MKVRRLIRDTHTRLVTFRCVIPSKKKIYSASALDYLISTLRRPKTITTRMPLHLPRIFSHHHSRSRTDLCSTYAHTYQERQAQGYGSRSEWTESIVLLSTLLQIAAEQHDPPFADRVLDEGFVLDWNTWSVDTELKDVRRFHFEDLDQTDQMLCTSHCKAIAFNVARLESIVNAGTMRKLEDVVGQLRDFKEQAQQLYGKKACATKASRIYIIPGALTWA